MSITIYGASDDLIEIDGDVREEFNLHDDDNGDLLALSNGCVFRIVYDQDGCWRITPFIIPGSATFTKVEATSADSDSYSDLVTVEGFIGWVIHGTAVAVADV